MQAQDCRFYCWDFLKSWTCPNEKSSSLAKEKGTEKLWNMESGELPALRKYVQFLYHSERKKKLFCVIVLGFLRRSVSRNSKEPQHTSQICRRVVWPTHSFLQSPGGAVQVLWRCKVHLLYAHHLSGAMCRAVQVLQCQTELRRDPSISKRTC